MPANKSVNCDNAEQVGRNIQDKLDDQPFHKCIIKRADHVTTLGSMKNIVQIDKNAVNIDPSKLFSRLIVICERDPDIKPYFNCELTPIPTSLFAEGLMRKPNKAQLIEFLFGKNCQEVEHDELIKTEVNVIDGGALLRKISWTEKSTFKVITDSYSHYLRNNFGSSVIIFDGYGDSTSTKDQEHSRRSKNKCHDFNISQETVITVSQTSFLANDKNKSQFLNLLIPQLRADGHTVRQTTGDADTMIVKAAIDVASEGRSVSVYANDTDVLVMLIYHWMTDMGLIVAKSDFMRKGYKVWKQLNIMEAASALDKPVRELLPFLHAFGGCDTTSSTHDKGKSSVVKIIRKNESLQEKARTFMKSNATTEEIQRAGVDIFVALYGGKVSDTLPLLRHRLYLKMAACSSNINPSKLPPTERTAHYHSMRVYLQVDPVY